MKRGKKDAGFTLVELIIVIVILAIIAAILVPALLGYIDESKKKQHMLDARNLLIATQSELTKIYAERDPYHFSRETDGKCVNIVENGRGERKATCMVNDYAISRDIFKLAGYDFADPKADCKWYQKAAGWNLSDKNKNKVSFFCIGMGNYDVYCNPDRTETYDPHKAYTAYFVIYQPYEGADFVFYDGNTYLDKWPMSLKMNDTFNNNVQERYKYKINGEEITIQFYMFKIGEGVQNKKGDKEFKAYTQLIDKQYS